jgi:hypothetical protein
VARQLELSSGMAQKQPAMSSRTPGRLSELRRQALWPSDTVARIAVRRSLAVLDRTPCELAAFREFVARIHQRMSAGESFTSREARTSRDYRWAGVT